MTKKDLSLSLSHTLTQTHTQLDARDRVSSQTFKSDDREAETERADRHDDSFQLQGLSTLLFY